MGRGPTGNDQKTRTPIIVILLFHIISVRKQELTSSSVPPVRCLFFLCGEYVFNRFHTITHTAHIHKHTHAHSHSHEKKNTRILYMKKKLKNHTMHIILIYEKQTRKQETSASPLKQAKRNAGDFLGRQSLVLQKASSHTIMPGEICMLENE